MKDKQGVFLYMRKALPVAFFLCSSCIVNFKIRIMADNNKNRRGQQDRTKGGQGSNREKESSQGAGRARRKPQEPARVVKETVTAKEAMLTGEKAAGINDGNLATRLTKPGVLL